MRKGHSKMTPADMEKVMHGKGPKPTGGAAAAQRKGHSGMGGKRGY
jgi:hypothetical protein